MLTVAAAAVSETESSTTQSTSTSADRSSSLPAQSDDVTGSVMMSARTAPSGTTDTELRHRRPKSSRYEMMPTA